MTKNSHDWCKLFNINEADILDPDGWDRRGDYEASWNEEITIDEFNQRLGISTVNLTKTIIAFFDAIDKSEGR